MRKRSFLRRALTLALAAMLCLSLLPAVSALDGGCGERVAWTLDDAGTLTISGTGDMWNSYDESQWSSVSGKIKRIVIEEGVTRVGNYAFCFHDLFQEPLDVSLPQSLRSIGERAFSYCKINEIALPNGLSALGEGAFSSCRELKCVEIPGTVTELGNYIFSYCHDLTEVILDDGVPELTRGMFSECQALERLTIPATVKKIADNAFEDCKSGLIITFGGTYQQWVEMTKTVELPENITVLTDEPTYPVTVLNGQAWPARARAGETVGLIYADALDQGYLFQEWRVLEGDVKMEYRANSFRMPASPVTVQALYTIPGKYSDEPCENCHGTGTLHRSGSSTCSACGGTGVEYYGGTTCAICDGRGSVSSTCSACKGLGYTMQLNPDHGGSGDNMYIQVGCSACNRTGKVMQTCSACRGIGRENALSRTCPVCHGYGSQTDDVLINCPVCNGRGNKLAVYDDVPITRYTLSFDMNGHGEQIPPQTVLNGLPATQPPVPEEEGWIFGGWYDDQACSRMHFFLSMTQDQTIYAKWTKYEAPYIPFYKRENPFSDVADDDYYSWPVLWGYYHEPQITNGTSATIFSPNATCTRAQVVTFLWRANGCPEPSSSQSKFTDVKDGYYYKAVLWAVENGITNGTSATTFSPDAACTRAQVVTFLWRTEGEPKSKVLVTPFRDVPSKEYYFKAVCWAYEKKITDGKTALYFAPGDSCSRGQIVTFLFRDMVEQ